MVRFDWYYDGVEMVEATPTNPTMELKLWLLYSESSV